MLIARTVIATGALILALGASAGPVAANTQTKAWSMACRHDAFAFCRLHALAYDVPGVRDCLIRNLDRVSEACRGVIKAAQSQHSQTPITPAQH